MKKFELVKRDINDYFSTLGPKLILIADRPLTNDKKEIFDSPAGVEYLSNCFKSRFKSAETHVTYLENCLDDNFCRKGLFSIIHHYIEKGTLDFNNLFIGFVGEKAFDLFMDDYKKHLDSERIQTYVSLKKSYVEVLDNDAYRNPVKIPFLILPNVDSDENNSLMSTLDGIIPVNKKISSPYCTTEQIIQKLKNIEDFYNTGLLSYFRFDMKIDGTKGKISYFRVYDNCTNVELLYCPNDEIAINDSAELKTEFRLKLKDVLTTIPVYNSDDTLSHKIKILGFHDKITVYTRHRIDEKPSNRESFVSTGNLNGTPSEWYKKWHEEVFVPNLSKTLDKKKIADEGYDDKNKYEWIYDIEVFKNDWLFLAKTADKKNKIVCWNDPERLRDWIKNKILIGFNNTSYDDNVIKYAMSLPYLEEGAMSVKEFSDKIINGESPSKGNVRDKAFLRHIREANRFLSWDIGFHQEFDIRRHSLKKLTMSVLNRKNYDSSVPFDIDRTLTALERQDVEKYCEMDVDNTLDLFLQDPEDIEKLKENPKHKSRDYASQSYDIRWNMIVAYSMTPRTLMNRSASFAGKVICGEDAKPNLTNTMKLDPITGEMVYYSIPALAYEELKGHPILDFYIKHQKNPDYITEKIEIYMGGEDNSHMYQFGFGGLHQALERYGSQNLVNMDVASLYPSLLIQYNLMSRGASNPDSYKQIYDTRINAKRTGQTLLNLGLKLVLNSAIGAMLTEYNPLFDTWSNSSVCVHGQLLLFILAKRLFDAGFNIVQTNTDGIMIERKEGLNYEDIVNKWQEETRLVLEFDDIAVLQQNNVNNYYCQFTNGKVKSKGFYMSNEKFGKATSKILCNLVTQKPLLEGVVARDFVIFKKHAISEIYDGKTNKKLEGRSLAFVVGKEDDDRTQMYYSRSKNEKETFIKDEKGKFVLDENGNKVIQKTNSISKITGFTDNMLLIDDIDSLTMEEINVQEYINFAKNLLNKEEDFGPYYATGYVKTEEPAYLQSLNPLKDNTDLYPTKAGVWCRNLLYECDYLSKEEQEELIKRIEPYTYRIVWSGNRSYHIVVRLNKRVLASQFKNIWYYLEHKLGLDGADTQCDQPNRYTRVPNQINPKTGNMQTLYSECKYEFDVDEILENLPKLDKVIVKPKEYKGQVTIKALERHIKRQDWTEGNRFTACQKLSPVLISQVTLQELLKMLPCRLERNHLNVLRSKYHYYIKNKGDESGE